jgi:hypothetical protein
LYLTFHFQTFIGFHYLSLHIRHLTELELGCTSSSVIFQKGKVRPFYWVLQWLRSLRAFYEKTAHRRLKTLAAATLIASRFFKKVKCDLFIGVAMAPLAARLL